MTEVPQPNVADLHNNPETMHLFLAELNEAVSANRTALEERIATLEEEVGALSFEQSAPAVYFAQKTDTQTVSIADAWIDVDSFSLTVTVTENQSVLLSMFASFGANSTARNTAFRVLRGSTVVTEADAGGNRTQATTSGGTGNAAVLHSASLSILDETPGAGEYTYTVQVRCEAATVYLNRSSTDGDTVNFFRGVTTLHALPVIKQ